MIDIHLHPLLENNEVCGDVIVIGGQCHKSCCCGRSVNMHSNDAIVQTAHEFCFVVWIFSLSPLGWVEFSPFQGCWWFLVSMSDLKYIKSLFVRSSPNSFHVA
jgi:hypothetical protein